MRFGLVYKNAFIYNFLLWILYRGNPRKRFQEVADEIPAGSTVLDLCAGTDILYQILKTKVSHYKAIDINPHFVQKLISQGVDAEVSDVTKINLPPYDVVVMNSSLYHFGPDASHMINLMKNHARKKVIILEPIKNNSSSNFSVLAKFAKISSQVNGVVPTFHFNEHTFTKVINQYGNNVLKLRTISSGRDMLAVIKI